MAPFKILSGKFKGTFTQFNPTPPSQRLVKTFGEVQSFKRQLLLAEKGLMAHASATADLVKLVDETITAFPRVWSRSDDGVSAQLHEEDHLKPEPGNNKIVSYPSNTFRQSLEADLKEEVYIPIERWHTRYREVKGRIGEVETARLEYDKARQKLGEAHKHALKVAAKSDAKLGGGNEGDIQIRQAEAALAATREEYVRIEEAVHVELAVLVMDAQNALDYVTRALTLSSRALLDIATHHQQETVKTLPVLVTESSGPLLLGPASPMATSLPPTPLALGAPPARTISNLGSPGSTPGTPLSTGAPSPLGPGAVAASPPAAMAVPPTTPEQPSFEAAGVPGGYEIVKELVVAKPVGAPAPVTPAKESTGAPRQMPVTPEYGSTGGGQMGGQTGAGQMGGGQMGSHPIGQDSEVDTPFGPATVNSESGFDNKRQEFLQQYG